MERCGSNLNPRVEGKIRTSASTFFKYSVTPFELDGTPGVMGGNLVGGEGSSVQGDGIDASLSLNKFFMKYTSEDNESFSKIMERDDRKRKERYGYLFEGNKKDVVMAIEDVKRDKITDGYGTSGQPTSTLEGWKYTVKNLLMYHPTDRGEDPLNEDEMEGRLKGMTKEIDRYNTRFHGKMLDSRPKDEDEVEVLYTTVAGATLVMAERDRDKTKKLKQSEKKADNGYSFVRSHSPAPGVDASPFITWGEIKSPPLRLEPEDTPLDTGVTGDGLHFKIPCPPSQDIKAHSLSREAACKLKERSRMLHRPPRPSPMRSGSASPIVRNLFPAAQKFMRNAMAKSSSSVDESLRASYRGNSPALSTPKSGRSMSRLARDVSIGSRSPFVREGSNPPW